MSAQPIRVVVSVGASKVRDLTLVGDPEDALLAHRIGQGVAVAVLEMGAEQ